VTDSADLDYVASTDLINALSRRGTAVAVVILDYPDTAKHGKAWRLFATGRAGSFSRLTDAVAMSLCEMHNDPCEDPDDLNQADDGAARE